MSIATPAADSSLGLAKTHVYPDLKATVYAAGVPDGLADELPGLYNTLLSTLSWFLYVDEKTPSGACVLDDPHHVLLFCVVGDTIEILNKFFDIAPVDAARARQALFEAVPQARRIHLETKFVPGKLHGPKRELWWTDHSVLVLPATGDDYTASLSKHTRANLRQYDRRLRRDYPDATMELVRASDRGQELVDQFLEWKIGRFNARGKPTFWETEKGAAQNFKELVAASGHAYVALIGGRTAAIWFVFVTGTSLFSLQGSFDPGFERYALGSLMHWWVHCDAAERGVEQIHLGWGADAYMQRYGMQPVRAWRVSIFRRQFDRVHSLKEAWEAFRVHVKHGKQHYWRVRATVVAKVKPAYARVRRKPSPRPDR